MKRCHGRVKKRDFSSSLLPVQTRLEQRGNVIEFLLYHIMSYDPDYRNSFIEQKISADIKKMAISYGPGNSNLGRCHSVNLSIRMEIQPHKLSRLAIYYAHAHVHVLYRQRLSYMRILHGMIS